jgi:hypothetical protein
MIHYFPILCSRCNKFLRKPGRRSARQEEQPGQEELW